MEDSSMTSIRTNSAIILMILFVVGCASAPAEEKTASGLPIWVMSPAVEEGFVDTQCVADNASLGILKSKATALARAEITRQVDLLVKTLVETNTQLFESTTEGATTMEQFEAKSDQVAAAFLSGSRVTRAEYVDFPDGTRQLCVMVSLDAGQTRQLYGALTDSLGDDLSEEQKGNFVQEFAMLKTQQELESK
jgi:hypothetical protein